MNPYPDGLFGCTKYCAPKLNFGNSTNNVPYKYGSISVAFKV
jgi:hypothetical protein